VVALVIGPDEQQPRRVDLHPWFHDAMTASEQIDQLEDRLASLELELAMLRASVEERLRTRRLVVVDEHGVERIVLEATSTTGSVLVRLAGAAGQTTGMEIYATESEGGAPDLGWCVLRNGDVVSRWIAG
jgi:hypothetical protein